MSDIVTERGQEEKRGEISYFTKVDLKDLEKAVKDCIAENKYAVIADLSGKAHTFMSYNYNMFEVADECKMVFMQKSQTYEDVSAKMRKKIVAVYNSGNIVVFHMKNQCP